PALGIPKDSGELVRSVVAGAPGANAGLVQGDVIVKVNGKDVTPDQTVSYLVANTPVGQRIPLEIIRGGKRATVYVTVAQRPTEEQLAKLGGGTTTPGGNTPPSTRRGKADGRECFCWSSAALPPPCSSGSTSAPSKGALGRGSLSPFSVLRRRGETRRQWPIRSARWLKVWSANGATLCAAR